MIHYPNILFALITILLAFPCLSPAEDLKEVVVEGIAIVGEDTTKSEARIMALNNARRNAIEEASGVSLYGSTLVSDYTVIFDLIKASSSGLIVKEEILDEDKKIIKERTQGGKVVIHETYTVRLKAIVKPIDPNRAFRITKLTLHKAGEGEPLEIPSFSNNEEAQIRVRVNEDSQIHIFSIGQDGAVTKLLPSQYFPPVQLRARDELTFPNKAQRELGLRLRVQIPDGLRKAVESLVVIATKHDEEFLQHVKEPTLIDLWKELSEIDPSRWAEAMVGYEVRR